MSEPVPIITCEHAVNYVPGRFRALFNAQQTLLNSHRGYDAGALELAESLAEALGAPCYAARVTRLLIDHNRSPHNPALWSPFSRQLTAADRDWLLETCYRPFRARVGHWIDTQLGAGQRVLHLAVHSFTPNLDGQLRRMDVGILYDPRRDSEAGFARLWQQRLQLARPELRVRRNAPYRGTSDGHQTGYRRQYAPDRYLGIELEVNQALVDDARWRPLQDALANSLAAVLKLSAAPDAEP